MNPQLGLRSLSLVFRQQVEDVDTASIPTLMDSTLLERAGGAGSSVIPRTSEQVELYGSRLSRSPLDPATTLSQQDCRDSIAKVPMTLSVGRGNESAFRRSEAGMQAKTSLLPACKSTHNSMSVIPGQGQKIDGKEFFRQARNRLSYQQFSAFLSNIKELNSHRQSREETLAKAEQIFGPENRDLYYAFDGLIIGNAT